MSKLASKIKTAGKIIALVSVVLLAGAIFFHYQCPKDKKITTLFSKEECSIPELIPEEKYTPKPNIPFISKDKPPVKKKDLPIPKKKVDKTISIDLPGSKKVTLVIDKAGKIYKTKDMSEEAKIVITKWKPKFFALGLEPGYSLAFKGRFYHCFTLDVVRIWKFHGGGEFGFSVADDHIDSFLLGLSGKYNLGTVDIFKMVKFDVLLIAGWDFLSSRMYGGVSIKW